MGILKRMTWRNLRVGDAFRIPLHGGSEGVGIVLLPGQELYLGFYSGFLEEKGTLARNINSLGALRLVGLTTDELFYHGDWNIIGNFPVPIYPRPKHVVNCQEGLVLCDFDRKILRQANKSIDLPLFGYRKSVSNISFTKALNCIHKLADLEYDFTKIDVNEAWKREHAS